MRIALLHFSYSPVIGGVEIVLAAHARLLAEAGHTVTVLCETGTSDDPRVTVTNLPEAAGQNFLQRALADQDVVFVHNVLTMPFRPEWTRALIPLAAELPRTRFINWIHDLAAINPYYTLAPELRTLLGTAPAHFEHIAVSPLRQTQFQELTGASCRVIPNGIDPAALLRLPSLVAELERRFQLLDRNFVLLHPTRLLARKNVELGLRVTRELLSSGDSSAYVVTGSPDPHNPSSVHYAQHLAELRTQLDLGDHVIFVHEHFPAGGADVAALYALAGALFFPSHQEGFGLPVLEAALHRLPIFCSEIPPLHTLLKHGVTTFSPDAAPAAVAQQVRDTLLANSAFRARREAQKSYSWTAIYRNYLSPLLASPETPFPV